MYKIGDEVRVLEAIYYDVEDEGTVVSVERHGILVKHLNYPNGLYYQNRRVVLLEIWNSPVYKLLEEHE